MTDSEKIDLMLFKFDSLEKEMQGVKSEVKDLKSEMQDMKTEIQGLKQRTENIENNVTDIKLTIENEIRVNIQRVAEGHLDLSRNLNACIKLLSDIRDKQEVYDIYIKMHHNKLKALEA